MARKRSGLHEAGKTAVKLLTGLDRTISGSANSKKRAKKQYHCFPPFPPTRETNNRLRRSLVRMLHQHPESQRSSQPLRCRSGAKVIAVAMA